MSFILDALRRAEQERNLGQTPSLQSATTGETKARKRVFWPWLLVILALLCSNIFFWTQWWGRSQTEAPTTQSEVINPKLKPEPEPLVATNQDPKKSADPVVSNVTLAVRPLKSLPATEEGTPVSYQALSLDVRQSMPSLSLDIHVFSDAPERRFVLLNGKRYQQGEWLDEGPLLESITEQGVILVYQNQRFELAAQR